MRHHSECACAIFAARLSSRLRSGAMAKKESGESDIAAAEKP
jgi:hypothetical protein